MERIGRLLEELHVEIYCGIGSGELKENLGFKFFVPNFGYVGRNNTTWEGNFSFRLTPIFHLEEIPPARLVSTPIPEAP